MYRIRTGSGFLRWPEAPGVVETLTRLSLDPDVPSYLEIWNMWQNHKIFYTSIGMLENLNNYGTWCFLCMHRIANTLALVIQDLICHRVINTSDTRSCICHRITNTGDERSYMPQSHKYGWYKVWYTVCHRITNTGNRRSYMPESYILLHIYF